MGGYIMLEVKEVKAEEKDSTYAVKLEGSVKKDLQELLEGYKQQDNGNNAGDFIKTLLEVYKTNKIVSKISNADTDIKELNTLVNRIYNIYGNILERNSSNNDSLQVEFSRQLEQKETTINNLKIKLEGLSQEQEELTQAFNSICEDKKELESNNIQLQKLNDSLEFNNSKLIEDTKGLQDLKQVNNKLLNENETIKVLLASQQADNIDLKNSLKDKDFTISGQNKEVEELKQDKLKALDQLKEKHNSQLEQLRDKASLVMETALLNLKKVQQDQLSQEQSKHNTMIETYQAKYKALLEELEQERSIPKVKANK